MIPQRSPDEVGRGQVGPIAASVLRQPDLIVSPMSWPFSLRSGSGQLCFDVRDEVVEHPRAGRCEREAAIVA